MKRLLDPDSLRALARGCAVLGAGGGGDTYIALLQALQATEDHGPAPLVDLDELPDDSLIMPCGGIGPDLHRACSLAGPPFPSIGHAFWVQREG